MDKESFEELRKYIQGRLDELGDDNPLGQPTLARMICRELRNVFEKIESLREPERVGYTLVPGIKKFIADESTNGKGIYEQSVKSWIAKCSYHLWLYLFETTIEDSVPEITFEQWQDIRKQFGLSYRDEE